jgi:hypothetical protein
MPSEEREKLIEWICRILMTIDIFVIIAGYLSYFQAKRQLDSPLIPKSAVIQILSDTGIMERSTISAIPFLIGLWFYSFKLKIPAIILFGLTIVVSKFTTGLF